LAAAAFRLSPAVHRAYRQHSDKPHSVWYSTPAMHTLDYIENLGFEGMAAGTDFDPTAQIIASGPVGWPRRPEDRRMCRLVARGQRYPQQARRSSHTPTSRGASSQSIFMTSSATTTVSTYFGSTSIERRVSQRVRRKDRQCSADKDRNNNGRQRGRLQPASRRRH
jgi:hypothetical protein